MQNHKILRVAPANFSLQQSFSRELGISKILSQILINRQINDLSQARKFLEVSSDNLLDPYSFSRMPQAVSLIDKALKNKDKVMVFGDYDVDGITALALVKETLTKMGLEVLHYLPHRINEGYGLSENIASVAKERNVRLLITVDCGISNHKQIEELKKNKIETIITDHHEPSGPDLPAASSIINPKIEGAGYACRDLAGVGVAYKLCQAASRSDLLEDLDLVSLGTIADSAALTGENRIIAKEGLLRLSRTSRIGLQVLIEKAGIKGKKFTSTYVSFILGPRLNASGRIDSAETSLSLLMSRTVQEAEDLSKIVESHNRQRQKIESRIMEEAEAIINRDMNFKEHKVIVIAKEDWHMGVLGIVASKIADRFYRPAVVISLSDDLCKGSARSIRNFHLFDALKDCRKLLDAFGGHSHAAGLVITKDNIDEFRQSINRLAHERLSLEDLFPSLDIDLELGLSELSEKAVEELEKLEPYGKANPEPLFYTRGLKLKGQLQVLGRETLKFWVSDGDITYQAIGFGMSGMKESFACANSFDLVYTPRIDSWMDNRGILLEAKDVFFR
jgi:single-stranded-DNA-specific exonuclease